MAKIKRCIEVSFDCPCNLACSYCYLPMRNNGNTPDYYGKNNYKKILQEYDTEHIGKVMSKRRLGGACFINITGGGETLIYEDVVDITRELLTQGHYLRLPCFH